MHIQYFHNVLQNWEQLSTFEGLGLLTQEFRISTGVCFHVSLMNITTVYEIPNLYFSIVNKDPNLEITK